MRGLGWGPLSSSSCRNGSRGALGLGLLQWLSHNNGLVPSAIEGWASLRFPFLFRYWRQIWPVLVLARRSQVPSRWHRDGGKCGRSPIQTFPRHLDQTGGNMRRDSVVVFVGGGGGGGGGWVWGLPPLASQPGCRAVAKRLPNAHPVPGLPALLRHRGNCPGRGACLGSSVESSTRCSGLRRFPFFSSSTGPIATGSRRRRLVLKPSQKDALQALFQQNPYPGIATRERLARELGIDESRVQVGPPPLHPFSLSRLSMPIQGS